MFLRIGLLIRSRVGECILVISTGSNTLGSGSNTPGSCVNTLCSNAPSSIPLWWRDVERHIP